MELFGIYALYRPIRLSDFSEYELQKIRLGNLQLLPFRDRSGRRILSIVGNLAMEFDPTLRAKAYFYFWMIASDDIESQQKGVVFLVWPTLDNSVGSSNNNSASASGGRDRDSGGLRGGRSSNFTSTSSTISNKLKQAIPDQTDRRLHIKMNAAAPIRICAVHFCYPNKPFYHVLRSVMTMTLGIHYRHRLKFHVGEGIELQYILKSYGIPIENLPITDTGNIKTTYLKQWLRVRKIVEVEITPSGQSTKLLSIIECPRSVDVIFRPGTSMLCHPGNVTFRGLIESKQHRTAVKRSEKEKVALEIINDIQLLGGRFLNWNNIGYWMDITHNLPVCVDKIVVSYRDYKKKVRNATNAAMLMNNNSSSGNGNGSSSSGGNGNSNSNGNGNSSGSGGGSYPEERDGKKARTHSFDD